MNRIVAFLLHQAGTIHEPIHRNRDTSPDLFHILPSGCYDRKCSRDLVAVQQSEFWLGERRDGWRA